MTKGKILGLTCIMFAGFLLLTSCSSNECLYKSNKNCLYPAFEKRDTQKVWGYINNEGKFIVQPRFQFALDFDDNGVAKIFNNGKMGLINIEGEVILPPLYDGITDFSNGLACVVNNGQYTIINMKGKEILKPKSYEFVGQINDDLISIGKKDKEEQLLMGFMDKNGNTVIEPQYKLVSDFKNSRAVVRTKDAKYQIINKNNECIKELSYFNVIPDNENKTFLFMNKNELYGFLDEKGDVMVEPKFKAAYPFEDGISIVTKDNSFDSNVKWGAIDKKGNFVIQPKYTSISYLGEGLFAVTKDKLQVQSNNEYIKKAIVDKEGKELTNFSYYHVTEVQITPNNKKYISVSDGDNTFFLNNKGEKETKLPRISGVGELNINNKIIKCFVDNRLSYCTLDGKFIWKEDNIYKLTNNAQVKEQKYSPNVYTTIYYPKLEGFEKTEVQNKINDKLYTSFVSDALEDNKKESKMTVKIDYEVKKLNDLLVIENTGYYYLLGAVQGIPSNITYHIDLNTGQFYKLKDLFKVKSDYVEKLNNIIKQQMEDRINKGMAMYVPEDFKGIEKDQSFTLNENLIQIHFYPFELSLSDGEFETFNIPYEDIKNIIDIDSKLWKLLNCEGKGK